MPTRSFTFEYSPAKLVCGRGCVADLDDELRSRNLERALVVCGSTVGSTPAVMDPIRSGLDDRLAAVFDETTPEKYLKSALEAVEAACEVATDRVRVRCPPVDGDER